MITLVYEGDQVQIPEWVVDLESFRRWAGSEEFPEYGRICFLEGEVWVDMSMEQLFTHSKVKGAVYVGLFNLVEPAQLGQLFPDGVLLTNLDVDLSVQPDVTYTSQQRLESGEVRLIEGQREGYVEIVGTPDMVLEVVSTSSVRKDTVVLRELYAEAGIPEYWLVDARKEPLTFDILRLTSRGYVSTRKSGGWIKSGVFGKSFQLTQHIGAGGLPAFRLGVR